MRLVRYTYPTHRSLSPFSGQVLPSPWTGLEKEIDRLFEAALSETVPSAPDRFPVDLYEDKDNTYVRAELPGVKREDVSVELTEGVLTLAARRTSQEGESRHAVELSRSLSVPNASVDASRITAALENGVLTVTLPKREESKPRRISVAVT
jgi:HSP20 family protein